MASILLLTAILPVAAMSQANESDKQRIVQQVAQKWIQVGTEQYGRGFFKAAEQSFLRARDYQEYLDDTDRTKLNQLLEKTHTAVLAREHILGQIKEADELEKQGELIKAKQNIDNAINSEFLSKQERELLEERVNKLDDQIAAQKKETAEIHKPAAEPAPTAQIEQPVENKPSLSVEVEAEDESPQGDVAAIKNPQADKSALGTLENKLLADKSEPVPTAEKQLPPVTSQQEQPSVTLQPDKPAPTVSDGGFIEVINRKRNVLRSHTRAVVNDAVTKAQNYISQGDFDNAKQAVETAERTVNKNQLYLGDDILTQYTSQLKLLSDKISQGQQEKTQQLQQQKQSESEQAQHQYREQMEVDRNKRIAELMDNAKDYQKKQKYEEALGQLESLIAIDPLNNDALILKQTLEDTTSFRKQLEIWKESDKERFATSLRTDESAIPFAQELTYPKNWREIAASPYRQPEGAIGQNPADAAVYKQLDEVVDLSELTPETPFEEAIGVLKNSVDPPLKIVVRWKVLYDTEIDKTTPINMDAISAVPLDAALKLLLDSVSGTDILGYVVENGVIIITTKEALPSPLITLVYNVTDLLGRPADYYAESPEEITADVEAAGAEGFQIEEELSREELTEMATRRAEALVTLIQESVEPDSWYNAGGEGTITVHENKKLIVLQTRKVHSELEKLLRELRKELGYQVAIEARFLLVGENFLEDIGLNLDIYRVPQGTYETKWTEEPDWLEGSGKATFSDDPTFALPTDPSYDVYAPYLYDWPGWYPGYNPAKQGYPIPFTDGDPEFGADPTWGDDANAPTVLLNPLREIIRTAVPGTGISTQEFHQDTDKFRFFQRHREHTWPEDTEIPGSWGSLLRAAEGYGDWAGLETGIGGMILDNLQVDLLLRATQAHRDATSLSAPKVSVLSGESATLRLQKIMWYPTDFEFDIEEIGELGDIMWTLEFEDSSVITGSILNITPIITQDKKNVLLNIVTETRDFLGWEQHKISGPQTSMGRGEWIVTYPSTELSRIETRVNVPDGGTLLLGGHKLTAEVELESGVPVLSKIPIIGRAFSNRSKVKDQRILLILVQPTIILQEEAEAEAIAAMQQ